MYGSYISLVWNEAELQARRGCVEIMLLNTANLNHRTPWHDDPALKGHLQEHPMQPHALAPSESFGT